MIRRAVSRGREVKAQEIQGEHKAGSLRYVSAQKGNGGERWGYVLGDRRKDYRSGLPPSPSLRPFSISPAGAALGSRYCTKTVQLRGQQTPTPLETERESDHSLASLFLPAVPTAFSKSGKAGQLFQDMPL